MKLRPIFFKTQRRIQQLERRDPTKEDEDEGGEIEDGESAEEEESSHSEGETEDNENEEDGEADPELRKKIEEALRASGVEPADDSKDDDTEEELMDDDQMMMVDEQLAGIFRSRASEKRGGKGMELPMEPGSFTLTYAFSRRKCSTRSYPFQEPRSRLGGYLCQETTLQPLYSAFGSTSTPACHQCKSRREPIVREGDWHPSFAYREVEGLP